MSESSQPVEIAPGLWIADLAGLASLQTVLATITHIVVGVHLLLQNQPTTSSTLIVMKSYLFVMYCIAERGQWPPSKQSPNNSSTDNPH